MVHKTTVLLCILLSVCQIECKKLYQTSKREEIESELYQNILPYIKLVKYDAEKTKQQIKRSKQTIKHHSKAKLLKELDKKVLPWLDELTAKVNAIANGKAKEMGAELRMVPNHIKGPSALNIDQIDQIGRQEFIKGSTQLMIAQEEAGQVKQTNQQNFQQLIENKKENSIFEKSAAEPIHVTDSQVDNSHQTILEDSKMATRQMVKPDKVIESEVAQLTNQIAEFQDEMNQMTNGIIFPGIDNLRHHIIKESAKPNLMDTSIFKTKTKPLSTMKTKTESTNKKMPALENISVFKPKSKHKKKKSKPHNNSGSVKIIFGGNVGFEGIVRYKVEAGICTYNESFDNIRQYLVKADHVVVSLDSPFIFNNDSILADKKLAEDESVKTFSYAGIDTVVLANNHILDYGPEVASYTAAILRQSNTLFSGFTVGLKSNAKQEPVIYATNGVTIGLLSYCMNQEGCANIRNKTKSGPAVFNESIVKEEVTALRESGIDVVVIYLHWGEEDDLLPTFKIKDIVRNLSGVKIDVIVGSHPKADGHYFFRGTLVVLTLGTFLTPMHIHLYKTFPGSSKTSKLINRLWDKQSDRWEMPALNSKLLQIEVNRDGLIPFKSKYLPIRMGIDENHCLQPERVPTEWWIPICTRRDKQCLGSSKCNELECEGSQ